MSRRKRFGDPDYLGDSGGINLTPLIDVVFVVLILFILIAPMLELEKVQLASGSGKEKQTPQTITQNPVTIHVQHDNTILVNRSVVALDQLLPVLQKLHIQNPRATPQLFHDKKGYFGTYQSVKNAVEAAGFEELDLILEPTK
jgi:biopolymer transport protein ExbD